ncbi:unknown protein [Calothrix sp. PCC 7716]|nr:unknown protein [Calothrix sp. PCC 7716]
MIEGRFTDDKELIFDIELVATNGEKFKIEALLDTGFTDGWLAINTQDLEALGWSLLTSQIQLQTAQGKARFNIYEGKIIIDSVEVIIPVHVGDDLPDTILGSFWLDIIQLIINKQNGIFTLEIL